MKTDKEMMWKTLSSEYLIRRPWLTARRDCVALPDGRENDEKPGRLHVLAEWTTDDEKLAFLQ